MSLLMIGISSSSTLNNNSNKKCIKWKLRKKNMKALKELPNIYIDILENPGIENVC